MVIQNRRIQRQATTMVWITTAIAIDRIRIIQIETKTTAIVIAIATMDMTTTSLVNGIQSKALLTITI